MNPRPILKQFAGLWTLTGQPHLGKEWSLEEKFRQAKAAGFDAMGGGPQLEVVPLLEKYGLEYICYIDGNLETYEAKLKGARAVRPARINVQLLNHDSLPREAVKIWVKLEAAAERMGLKVDLEVHRDTCTETPEKVYEIADRYEKLTGRKIAICWDFSHPAVVKHLSPPYADRLLVRPDLLQSARQMHFRPFNGHHAQIPATNGRGRETPEFLAYLDFVQAVLDCWLSGAKGGEILYACPEFGPLGGYGITGFPNVWKDAMHLRTRTAELWQARLRKWKR